MAKIKKRRRCKAIRKAVGEGAGSVRMLCGIADVSRKSYYHHLKGGSCSDDGLIREMATLQEESHGSLGYRKMARIIRNSSGKAMNEKKIRRIMKENGIQSAVRRRKYSEEVYAKRRQLKADVPPDLIRRGFFALEPRKKMAEDITYPHGAEGRAYLNTIEDLFNGEILAYRISSSPDSRLCIETVEDMVNRWDDVFDGAILHNDLG